MHHMHPCTRAVALPSSPRAHNEPTLSVCYSGLRGNCSVLSASVYCRVCDSAAFCVSHVGRATRALLVVRQTSVDAHALLTVVWWRYTEMQRLSRPASNTAPNPRGTCGRHSCFVPLRYVHHFFGDGFLVWGSLCCEGRRGVSRRRRCLCRAHGRCGDATW